MVTLLSSFLGHGSALPAAVNAQDVAAGCGDILNISVDGNMVARLAGPDDGYYDYYRGEGPMAIRINSTVYLGSTYQVASALGTCIEGTGNPTPCGYQAELSFAIDAAGNAHSQVDMDAIPPLKSRYVIYRLTGTATVCNEDDYCYTTNFTRDLFLTKNRLISFDDLNAPMVRFSVFQPTYLDGWPTAIPLVGETVTPSSSAFEFMPTTTTTDDDGRAYFFMIPVDDAAGVFVSSETEDYFSGEVSVDVAGEQKETFEGNVAFARVSCIRGAVFKVDGLGNETRLHMGDKLWPGQFVKLMGADYDEYGNPTINPMVCLDFYSGQRHVAQFDFAKEGSWVNIEIGPRGVSGIMEKSYLIDTSAAQLDVTNRHREYLRLAVYHVMASRFVAPLKWGWKASWALKKTIEVGLRRTFGSNNSMSPMALANGPLAGYESSALEPPGAQDAWLTADLGYTVPYVSATFMGDGSVKITNWDALLEISSQDIDTGTPRAGIVLPVGTYTRVDGEYTAFETVTSVSTDSYPGDITIVPADGSHLLAPPLIEVQYPWNIWDPVIQSTLDVRLNGVSITPYLYTSHSSSGLARWQTPVDWPFVPGENEIDAYIMTRSGAIYAAISHFTMDMAQQPQFLKAYRGPTSTILRWQPVQQANLTGYLVYRGSSATSEPLLTSSSLNEPVFTTNQPGWYYVAAVNQNGAVSPLTGPVLGDLDPTAIPSAPPAPQGFTVTSGEDVVTIDFEPGSFVPVYRLERAAIQAGPYVPVALLTSAPYEDRAVTAGATYWYRLLALGLDLTPSAPAGPLQATLTDLPPQSPTGLGVRAVDAGMRIMWDPSPEADLAGYNLYRAQLMGGFVKLNQTLLTTTDFLDDAIQLNSTYTWRLTAVDQQDLESQPSMDVEVSTWHGSTQDPRLYLPYVRK